jgi:hypothetical protein
VTPQNRILMRIEIISRKGKFSCHDFSGAKHKSHATYIFSTHSKLRKGMLSETLQLDATVSCGHWFFMLL